MLWRDATYDPSVNMQLLGGAKLNMSINSERQESEPYK